MSIEEDAEDAEDDDDIECWCGAKGKFDELFSAEIEESCHGSGTRHCYCGGDQCVCHWHGETECEGCEDCYGEDFGWYDEDDFEDDFEED